MKRHDRYQSRAVQLVAAFAMQSLCALAVGQPLIPLTSVQHVDTGRYHSCALLMTGTVTCWGANNAGQLGDGTTVSRPYAKLVPHLHDVVALSVGGDHSCALKSDGGVWCWGDNTYGQLGAGLIDSYSTIPKIALSLRASFISAGFDFTCALDRYNYVGRAYCWGRNDQLQLGDETKMPRNKPVPVHFDYSLDTLTAGNSHVCAIRSSDQLLICWGTGLLGNGVADAVSPAVGVLGISGVHAITAGGDHTCAELSTTEVWCWGENSFGQIGDNSTTARPKPVVVAAYVRGINAGAQESCYIAPNTSVTCWGANFHGQLGDGTTTESHAPLTSVPIALVSNVSVGKQNHVCAATYVGSVYCWGNNEEGQLGNGHDSRAEPQSTAPVNVLMDGDEIFVDGFDD